MTTEFRNEQENRLLQGVLRAREAACELGQGVLVHILDMALIELGADAVRDFNLEHAREPRVAQREQVSN